MGYNVFDFDKTIYDGDSTIDFYLYSIKKQPKCIIYSPYILWGFINYKMRICDKKKYKEFFFSFLKAINNQDNHIEEFWVTHQYKIKDFYLKRMHAKDIVISASPDFLLNPICKKLGVHKTIASKVDKYNGKFLSNNCYGEEKVERLKQELGLIEIKEFYSDSYTDMPLAKISRNAYLVKGNMIKSWSIEGEANI